MQAIFSFSFFFLLLQLKIEQSKRFSIKSIDLKKAAVKVMNLFYGQMMAKALTNKTN